MAKIVALRGVDDVQQAPLTPAKLALWSVSIAVVSMIFIGTLTMTGKKGAR